MAICQANQLKFYFEFVRMVPERFQGKMLKLLELMLGSHRGIYINENGKRVFRSVWSSPFTKHHMMYHPSALHQRIINKEIPGIVTFGNDFEVIHQTASCA